MCLTFAAVPAFASDPLETATAAMRALFDSRTSTHGDTSAFRDARKRYECVDVTGMRGEVVARSGDAATVRVDVETTARLPVTHAASDFPFQWLVKLRRSGDRWDVERVSTPESDLAARVAASSDRAARLAMLGEEPRSVTPELARCLVQQGSTRMSQSRVDDAAALAELALGVAQETGNTGEIARALYLLGRTFDAHEQYPTAMAIQRRAHALAESTHDTALIATTLQGVATQHQRRGESVVTDASEAYRLAMLAGEDRVAGAAMFLLGIEAEEAGRYGDAIKNYVETARLAKRCHEQLLEAVATAQTGLSYDYMNNHVLGVEFLKRGIALFRQAGNTLGVIRNLRNLADMEVADRRYAEAEKHLRETVALLEKHPHARTSAFVATTRGSIAAARHDFAAAERFNNVALEIARRESLNDLVTILTYHMAELRLDQKRYGEAVALATEAIQRASKGAPAFDLYWHTQMIRGHALFALGRIEESRASLENAIAAIEQTRSGIPAPDDDQQAFLTDKEVPYYEMFRTFIGRDPAEALLWVERARSRVLIEYLTHGHRKSIKSLSEAEKGEEARVEKEIVDANVSLGDARAKQPSDAAQVERLEQSLAELRHRRALLLRDLYDRHPDLAVARGDIPLPPVAEMRAAIGPDDVALEYVAIGDGAWVIAVTRDAAPRIVPIAANADTLQRLGAGLLKAVAARDERALARSRALYDLLLRPVEGLLRGRKAICIVADKTLHNVSFQLLADRRGDVLIRKHAVYYAPSLAFLVWHAKHPGTRGAGEHQLLALANPAISAATATKARERSRREALGSLPEAEREVRALTSIYGRAQTTLRVGAAATEDEFKHSAGGYRILHLATHGMYDDTDPMYSHLVLARAAGSDEDGLLEAREIVDLDLHADLAVLSACETGRAMSRGGEGMIGLSWAFLGAGCPAAVVSLWNVESAATARLMVEFHRRRAHGDSTPEALRHAELALMKDRRYHHPYYWAPFVVVGAP